MSLSIMFDVSTHSRPKAAGLPPNKPLRCKPFQLTAARRRLVGYQNKRQAVMAFQLTAARRRLGFPYLPATPPVKFQLTAARRRLVELDVCALPENAFQLTAARRRLAGYEGYVSWLPEVSTHSRPKAAGAYARASATVTNVSTHSRPKAAGRCYSRRRRNANRFNSQPPEGGWLATTARRAALTTFQLTAARRRLAFRPCRRSSN